jgi:uncharacterized protein Yka (UPF0111/DUF47 family)
MINFFLGLIVGILIRDIKIETINKIDNFKKKQENKGSSKFFEPISQKEMFESANSLEDLLNK